MEKIFQRFEFRSRMLRLEALRLQTPLSPERDLELTRYARSAFRFRFDAVNPAILEAKRREIERLRQAIHRLKSKKVPDGAVKSQFTGTWIFS